VPLEPRHHLPPERDVDRRCALFLIDPLSVRVPLHREDLNGRFEWVGTSIFVSPELRGHIHRHASRLARRLRESRVDESLDAYIQFEIGRVKIVRSRL
jgi:hypothetical protein